MAEEPPAASAAQSGLSAEETQQITDTFNYLYHGLKEAQSRFVQPEAEYGGRDSAIHALEFVLKFFDALKRMGIYPLIVQDGVHAPLARLYDDLMSLDNGMVSPMLSPRKKRGRARASSLYDGMKAVAVFTVRHLAATGLSHPEARKVVARKLAKLGMRPARGGYEDGTGQFSERTLRKWQEDIGIVKTATGVLSKLEDAYLDEALRQFGLSSLSAGFTVDDLLLQHSSANDMRRKLLDKMARYLAMTRAQETT
jgi:hypothetical protein